MKARLVLKNIIIEINTKRQKYQQKKKVIIKEKILNFGVFFCVGWKKE